VLASLFLASGSGLPVSRHIGKWDSAPKKCPSNMVTDGPLLGNGDLGTALGGVVNGGMSYYLGKMDFWTQSSGKNGKTDSRHLITHVAAGFVTLKWGSSKEPSDFRATQHLEGAVVNATAVYPAASLTSSAIIPSQRNTKIWIPLHLSPSSSPPSS
jgi:hypothetical protein